MSIRRLFPDADPDEALDTPNALPGETTFEQYRDRRFAAEAAKQAKAQQHALDEQQAQFQRDQAATAKAYGSQNVAHYFDSAGKINPLTALDGGLLHGNGSDGSVVYDQAGNPSRVRYNALDTPALVNPFTREGGAAEKSVDGHKYVVSPGMPWQYAGPDPEAQAAQAEKERQRQVREQRQAAAEAAALSSQQVSQSRARLATHQKALEANTASLGGIQELAKFEDLGGDGIADHLEQHFSTDKDPAYN
jgi:ribosomal protein L9